MKKSALTLIALAPLAGCGSDDAHDHGDTSTAESQTPAVEIDVPTEEEAAAEAAAAIDEENFDSELEKLQREIEDDTGN